MPFECIGQSDHGMTGGLRPWDVRHAEPGTVDIRMSAPRSDPPLPTRHILIVATVAAALVSIRFVMLGAWPVLIFSILDIGGLAVALVLFARSQPPREHLRISRDRIALIRFDERGRSASCTLPTFWTKVETISRSEVDCAVYLVFRQQRVAIARCLSDAERRELAPQISKALCACRG